MASHVLQSVVGSWSILASIIVLMAASESQATSSEGGEFFIAFPRNTQFSSENLRVFVSTQEPNPVHFTLASSTILYSYSGTVTNQSVVEIAVPQYFEISSINDRGKGLRLRVTDAGKKVSVFVTKDASLGSGGYLALPCERYPGVANYTYSASSYLWGNRTNNIQKSNAVLIGCENNTQITIFPSSIITIPTDLRNLQDPRTTVGSGQSYTITLNRLQTVQLETVLDLTGTKFVSNKPIALLAGHECADVPINVPFCDYIIEQFPPTLTWGRLFFIAASNSRSANERFKITTLKQTTFVKIYCSPLGFLTTTNDFTIATLQSAGTIYEFEVPANKFCSVQSTKPIQLVQYSAGYSLDSTGDPFMLYVPPVEQFTNNYTIKSLSGFDNHMTVVVPARFFNANDIRINGAVIPALSWSRIFCSNSVTCGYGTRMALTEGLTYHIRHSNAQARLSVFSYGFEFHTAYGYAAGMALKHITDICDEGSLRLDSSVQQQPILQGRVEVCLAGVWSSVCGRGWDEDDAAVVCRQLGYSPTGALGSVTVSPGANHTSWPFIFSNVRCTGSEVRLVNCNHDNSIAECLASEEASVQCQQFPSPNVTVSIATPLFERSEAILRCTVYIESALTNQIAVSAVAWSQDGHPLIANDDVIITSPYQEDGNPNEFFSDVTIASLSADNEGAYSCTANVTSTITGATVSTATSSTNIILPERESALFQLRLIGVGHCSNWLLQFSTPAEKADEVIDDIITSVQLPCQCSITTNHITDAVFQCFQQDSHTVTFRASVHPTPLASTMNIISNITAWAASRPSVSVHGVLLSVDPECVVGIPALSASECQREGEGTTDVGFGVTTTVVVPTTEHRTEGTTSETSSIGTTAPAVSVGVSTESSGTDRQTTPTLGGPAPSRTTDSTLNISAIIGGSVAVVTVFIIAVAVTILCAICLVLRFKRNTHPVAATNVVAIATGPTHTAEGATYTHKGEKPPIEENVYVDMATNRPHPPPYTPV